MLIFYIGYTTIMLINTPQRCAQQKIEKDKIQEKGQIERMIPRFACGVTFSAEEGS